MTQQLSEEPTVDTQLEVPYLARWAELGRDIPYSSTDMGKNDDTGTWRSDTEEADT